MILEGRLLFDAATPPEPGWLAVDAGRIVEVGHGRPPGLPSAGDEHSLISPGFIDAHLHLPQIESIGCEQPDLLTWLNEVVYPCEGRWGDSRHAAAEIRLAFDRLLGAGTLGFAGFLTSHATGPGLVAHEAHRTSLRCIVGQVLMDRAGPQVLINQSPQPPRPVPGGRVSISVNPRFAVACTDALLEIAGKLAGDTAPVQTHLAESLRECQLVRELFPADPSYASLYDRHHLLTPRTLLAHCVHLSEDQWRLIAKRQSVVVHCPIANSFLQSGLFDYGAALRHGVRLALGSDVAAGCDVAMPRVARAMIETAKARAMTIDPETPVPSAADAWNLITRGNADALGWNDAGRLEVGAAADLLVLRPTVEFDRYLIGRMLYTWRDDYIADRIVAGRLMPRQRTR